MACTPACAVLWLPTSFTVPKTANLIRLSLPKRSISCTGKKKNNRVVGKSLSQTVLHNCLLAIRSLGKCQRKINWMVYYVINFFKIRFLGKTAEQASTSLEA